MRNFLLLTFPTLVFICLYGCNDAANEEISPEDTVSQSMEDTVMLQKSAASDDDCNQVYFSGMPFIADTATVNLHLKNGHTVTWNRFVKEELMSNRVKMGLKSIDNDTIPELVVLNNTGGAHCCEELYIFARQGNDFLQKAKLFGGFICADPQTNIFTFSFTETLGYFFSCYSCIYADSSMRYRPIREIDLKFYNGGFVVVPYNADVEKQIRTNLSILKENGYVEVDQGLMDNGWRKEYAMNLAVWHFNHGKNWQATRQLFETYYPFKDAETVWSEFNKTLTEAGKENSF